MKGRATVIVGLISALMCVGVPAWATGTATAASGCATHEQSMCPIQQGVGPVRADFDGDGWDDVVFGVPFEDVGLLVNAGIVSIIPGGPSGLRFDRSRTWDDADLGGVVESSTQSVPGYPGYGEDGNAKGGPDHLGHAVAAGDFNGDGADDLAIGVPGQDIGDIPDAGVVKVVYGSRTYGLTTDRIQTLAQGDALQSAREAYDHFGESLAAGDINGDGRDELLIGVPDEDIGNVADAGAVHVVFGASFGLSRDNDVLLKDPDVEAGDYFGQVLGSGDLGLDRGRNEVIVGVPSEDHRGYDDAGAVHVWYGYPGGVSGFRQTWKVDGEWLRGRINHGASLGAALAVGDFDGNSYGDLAIGAPVEHQATSACPSGTYNCHGNVYVIAADEYGLDPQTARRWTATAAGIGYTWQDRFGASLAAGDFDADRRDDLAIGLPNAYRSSLSAAGAIRVLRGSPAGLSASGGRTLDQNWAGSGEVERDDHFGRVLLAVNVGGGAQMDLLVGVPNEDLGDHYDAGRVEVTFGGDELLGVTGQRFTQALIGLAVEEGDQFGLVAS